MVWQTLKQRKDGGRTYVQLSSSRYHSGLSAAQPYIASKFMWFFSDFAPEYLKIDTLISYHIQNSDKEGVLSCTITKEMAKTFGSEPPIVHTADCYGWLSVKLCTLNPNLTQLSSRNNVQVPLPNFNGDKQVAHLKLLAFAISENSDLW